MPTLAVQELTKRYGETVAVSDVSFRVDDGVVGILGPNGAGKSTLLGMLAGVVSPTAGQIVWNGTDVTGSPERLRQVCGYLPQRFGIYPDLTAVEYLDYIAALEGVPADVADERIGRLLETVNLADSADRKLGSFSGGMRRRAGIVAALLSDPELVVVDEPTAGLDPAERARFRNVLTQLGRDRTVILSTHVVPDVEATAGAVILLSDGELLDEGVPGEFVRRVERDCWTVETDVEELSQLRASYRVKSTTRTGSTVRAEVVASERPTPDATPREPTLEDAYLGVVEEATHGPADRELVTE